MTAKKADRHGRTRSVWMRAVLTRWPDADVIGGDISDDAAECWVSVSFCGRKPRLVLFESRKAAFTDHAMIELSNRGSVLEGVGCRRGCYNDHCVIDVTAEGLALADVREFGATSRPAA